MSTTKEPPLPAGIEMILPARDKDLGSLVVGRVLPFPRRRHLGPFVFFDHIGPTVFAPGGGMDVRPHPHIGLATMTYLFEGAILHRDSLGYEQPILPGAVNWMTAGRGIVHSERVRPEDRASGFPLHGIQVWIALPLEHEETEPEFTHYPADSFARYDASGVRARVIVGSAFGFTSPVRTASPLFYVEVHLERGATLELPSSDPAQGGYEERGAYVLSGSISVDDHTVAPRHLAVLAPSSRTLVAHEDSHLMLLGGAALEGERHIYWNFVSSRRERIEEAKRAWRAREFPLVPGDEDEFIPLPAD